MKTPKILYFISGPIPTEEQKAEVAALEVPVSYRNADHIAPEHKLEDAEGVAGLVPESYANYPTALVALESFGSKLAEFRASIEVNAGQLDIGDKAPPVPAGKAKAAAKPKASPTVADAASAPPAPAAGTEETDAAAPVPSQMAEDAKAAAVATGWVSNKG